MFNAEFAKVLSPCTFIEKKAMELHILIRAFATISFFLEILFTLPVIWFYWTPTIPPMSLLPISFNDVAMAATFTLLLQGSVYGAFLLLLLSFTDPRRAFDTLQWSVCILGTHAQTPFVILRLSVGAVYFWSGFWKLTSSEYYKITAPWFFEPMYNLLPTSAPKTLISGAAVLGELVVGCTIMSPAFGITPPPWLLVCSSIANIFMHGYILWFLGHISLLNWNLLCLVTAQACLMHSDENHLFATGSFTISILLALLYCVVPLLAGFGKSLGSSFCHTMFTGEAYEGTSFVLVQLADGKPPFALPGETLSFASTATFLKEIQSEGASISRLPSDENTHVISKHTWLSDAAIADDFYVELLQSPLDTYFTHYYGKHLLPQRCKRIMCAYHIKRQKGFVPLVHKII